MVRCSTNENTQYGLKRLENVEVYEYLFYEYLAPSCIHTVKNIHPVLKKLEF